MSSIVAIVFMYDINRKRSVCLTLWTNLLNEVVGDKLDLPGEAEMKNYAAFEGMIPMKITVKNGESVEFFAVFKKIGCRAENAKW